MVNKIISSFFFIELIIATFIALYWSGNNIQFHTINIAPEFLSLIHNTSSQLNEYGFEIPNIPSIQMLTSVTPNGDTNWWSQVLDFFINFANGFFTFLNGVILVLNFVINILNYFIQLIQFIAILFGNLFSSIDNLKIQTALS